MGIDAFGALPLLADADRHHDAAAWLQADGRTILRRNTGTTDAVKGRAGVGQFDQRGKPDAAIDAALAQGRLLGAQRRIIHQYFHLAQAGFMRQNFELDAGGAGVGVGVVGHHIAFSEFERIHAQLLRRQIHQTFGHSTGDRMTDAAILAGRCFVLEDHIQVRSIGLVPVRPTYQVDHLVTFDGAGARKHRIRADAGQVVDFKGQDLTVSAGGNAALDPMFAGVNVADERLQPVGHEFHRALEQNAQGDGGKIVRIGVHLDAERAADILADHAHRRFR